MDKNLESIIITLEELENDERAMHMIEEGRKKYISHTFRKIIFRMVQILFLGILIIFNTLYNISTSRNVILFQFALAFILSYHFGNNLAALIITLRERRKAQDEDAQMIFKEVKKRLTNIIKIENENR